MVVDGIVDLTHLFDGYTAEQVASIVPKSRGSVWELYTEEERQAIIEKDRNSVIKFWASPEGEDAKRLLSQKAKNAWAGKTPEEKQSWLDRSSHSPESRAKARPNIVTGNIRYWASLSELEYESRLEGLRNGWKHRTSSPTDPTWCEFFLYIYLEDNFPGKWTYNGRGILCTNIGGKLPDFTRTDGSKELIEAYGSYWHNPEAFPYGLTEKQLTEFYNELGYKCTVIWEEDCYLVEELDKIFGIDVFRAPEYFVSKFLELGFPEPKEGSI